MDVDSVRSDVIVFDGSEGGTACPSQLKLRISVHESSQFNMSPEFAIGICPVSQGVPSSVQFQRERGKSRFDFFFSPNAISRIPGLAILPKVEQGSEWNVEVTEM